VYEFENKILNLKKIILAIFPDAPYVLTDVKQYFTCFLFILSSSPSLWTIPLQVTWTPGIYIVLQTVNYK